MICGKFMACGQRILFWRQSGSLNLNPGRERDNNSKVATVHENIMLRRDGVRNPNTEEDLPDEELMRKSEEKKGLFKGILKMFGCLKLRNHRKTYVVNKGASGVSPSSDSTPRNTPPKRKVTKHSIQLPRPIDDDDDDPQQQTLANHQPTREEDLVSSAKSTTENETNPEVHLTNNIHNGNLIENDSDAQDVNRAEPQQVTNTVEDDDENVANLPQRSTQIEIPTEKPIADETNTVLIPVNDSVQSKIDDTPPSPIIDESEREETAQPIVNESESEQTPQTIVNRSPIIDESEREVTAQPIIDESEREVTAQPIVDESENEQTPQPIINDKSAHVQIATHEEIIGTERNQQPINVPVQTIIIPPEQIIQRAHAHNETAPLHDSIEENHQRVMVSGTEQVRLVYGGGVIQPGSEMHVVQNGGVRYHNVEVKDEGVQAQKSDGVTFTENVDVIYIDSDSDSISDVGVNETRFSEIRREGFREPVKIDDGQDIKTHPKSEQEALKIKKAFLANEFLETVLKDDQLNTLVDAMYLREVEENEVIIQEGEPGNHLYVSAGGTFDVYVNQKKVNSFSDFRVFGELAILYNAKRMATIKSMTAGRIWVLHRSIYQRTLVQDAIRDYEEMLSFLQNVPAINTLRIEKLRKIANLLKKEFFKTDTVIVQQGDVGDKFYIIRAGNVTVTRKEEGTVAELSKGAYFGERALLQEEYRQATVTADPPGVECLTLTRAEFKEHFDDDDFSQSGSTQQTQANVETKEPGEFAEIQIDDLKRVETLGVGGFGRVELVQHKTQTNLTFALKYLKKVDMVQQGQVDHVFNEKNIQITCNSVFVVRMYKTFSDNKYLYFLMESCLGGDLWTFLQRQKGRHVGDSAARFFAGCVLEALTYLHDRDYIYRDLKPENLIIDNNGYIKLTDFGFAKYVGRNGRTFTFAGTPEYVAPEIVYNRGHDKAVDYWAFGIFIFELLVGRTPFRSDDPSHMRTYNRILRGINSVQFPASVSRSGTIIIQKLCKAIPTERLGCQKNGAQDIRNHKWFQGLDWNKLRSRKLKAPFVPKLQTNTDTKYFEKFKPDDDVPPDELIGFDDFET